MKFKDPFNDYYRVIGLARDATPEQIKHAYRRLARKYHPDVSTEKNAEAHFKALAQAYEVLGAPASRAQYDRLATPWKAGQDFKPSPEAARRQDCFKPAAGEHHGRDASDFMTRYWIDWLQACEAAWAALRAAVAAPR
ncbi:DnaJ domain-containing protein [Polaromonas sp.]|uniref:DnaJ domain-containing protein n=1 Tax=Polaromonas sp. TaxID=1869339 RepID=UPI00286D60F1|nr:DnaJ domain-containing protein [Polaromonas sp.]